MPMCACMLRLATVCAGTLCAVQECASVLLRQWEPLVLQWPLMGPAARQDLLSKLASAELAFFLAVKDRAAYEEVRADKLLPSLSSLHEAV